jgi:hypothetical protein
VSSNADDWFRKHSSIQYIKQSRLISIFSPQTFHATLASGTMAVLGINEE